LTEEDTLIAGRYRLLSRIGRGAMGVVWRATDERLDRIVAVKQLLLDEAAGPATAEQAGLRVMREARVAARLRHPHAVTVHDVVEHDGKPYLIMEFLPSKPLPELGVVAPEYAARIGSQVASALAAAHAEGIVHRDVTPGNVLVTPEGVAKIADFGIARAAGEATVTGGGLIAGTPAFLAPEVAEGEEAGFPSDVFSLGATLYSAVEGTPPFGTDGNPMALLRRVARGEIIPPRRTGPLADVLLVMLHRSPAERPSMAEAHEALEAVADGKPVLPPPRTPTLLLPPRRSRRPLAAAVAAVTLVAAGILIGTLINRGQPGGEAAASTPSTTPATTPRPACAAEFKVTNAWPDGYQAEVTVRGDDRPSLARWTVRWELPAGHAVTDVWNGVVSREGSSVTVTNASWNGTVAAGAPAKFGLITRGTTGPIDAPVLNCESG
jgi:serine/threonine protein kinase